MENVYIDRMVAEKAELETKLEKLYLFMGNFKFRDLDEPNKFLLKEQAKAMNAYLGVLESRIKLNS